MARPDFIDERILDASNGLEQALEAAFSSTDWWEAKEEAASSNVGKFAMWEQAIQTMLAPMASVARAGLYGLNGSSPHMVIGEEDAKDLTDAFERITAECLQQLRKEFGV